MYFLMMTYFEPGEALQLVGPQRTPGEQSGLLSFRRTSVCCVLQFTVERSVSSWSHSRF